MCLWIFGHKLYLRKSFADAFQPQATVADVSVVPIAGVDPVAGATTVVSPAGGTSWELSLRWVHEPFFLYELMVGPNRRMTWQQTLPSASLKLRMQHLSEINGPQYHPKLKGALIAVGPNYSTVRFSQRIKWLEFLYQRLLRHA